MIYLLAFCYIVYIIYISATKESRDKRDHEKFNQHQKELGLK